MKRVYSGRTLAEVQVVRDGLRRMGIQSQVRNEPLVGLGGGIPFTECWVELWVAEADQAPAVEAIHELVHAGEGRAVWRCGRCGVDIPGELTECWQCQTSPSSTEP